MDLKVILSDDDSGMRMLLRKAIEKIEGFQIIGEAVDGEAALLLFEEVKPQIVFLDVEMPKLNGLECAKKIMDINPKTIIIFATAHNEYMPEAFQLYAFDYLVKPFKMERIYQTLERIKGLSEEQQQEEIHKISKGENSLHKIVLKSKDGISFIDMKDIIIIQREQRNTVIYTGDKSYITSEGLSDIEERLDHTVFFRSHKSYIINLSMIHTIHPYGRWTYLIKLKGSDQDALLTHEKYEEIKSLFSL